MNRRLVLVIAAAALVGTLATIYALAQQSTSGTQQLAVRVERMLARVIPPTGTGSIGEPTWWGLTIRRLAHVAEFALLGLVATVVAVTLWGLTLRAFAAAGFFCFIASLADELHKIFVPGRHFDPADLLLDAVGYVSAMLFCWLFACLGTTLMGASER